jgi:putative GTP pyrophosphokinase
MHLPDLQFQQVVLLCQTIGPFRRAMINEELLSEFATHLPALEQQRALLEQRLTVLLKAHQVETQFVSSRLKSADSLRRKLGRPDKTYRQLWDVTDLIGLRIATYFEDSIEQVARAIERDFEVDFNHSTEKDRFSDQGRFGYRSLHYVCRLPASAGLPSALRFEIQVRTSLQHAWAEVEHDLGYKANEAVPEPIRRRFSRIASVLEIADQEFVAIRSELASYRRSAKAGLRDPGQSFPLDVVTLVPVANDALVVELDTAIGQLLGRKLGEEVFFPEYLVKMLTRAGLHTTREVMEALGTHADAVRLIVNPYFEFTKVAWSLAASSLQAVPRGYCLFFLAHVVILRGPELGLAKVAKLARLYGELDYPDDEQAAQRVASALISALRPHL